MTEKAMTEKAKTGSKSSTGSKFSGLLAAVHERQESDQQENDQQESGGAAESLTEQKPDTNHTQRVQKKEKQEKEKQEKEDAPDQEAEVEGARRGRPRGKRSSDDFVQVTAYIGKDTHRGVKIALLGEGEGREFSELVEELLADWLKLQK